MTDIYTWSLTAADNDDADSAINWAEFQDADTVNNSARQMMARVAEFRDDLMPTRTSSGSSNAYSVTSSGAPSALTANFVVWFVADKTNTGAATLTVDALTSKPLRAKSGQNLSAGDIQASTIVGAYYNVETDEYLIVNSGFHTNALAPTIAAANNTGLKVGDVLISLDTTPKTGRVRLTEATQSLTKTTYPDLNTWASNLGYPWGSAATTFNIPPAAGYFLRFAATTSTIDTGGARTAGSTQSDQNKTHTHAFTSASHTHTVSGTTDAEGEHTHTYSGTTALEGAHVHGFTASGTTNTEPAHTHTIANAGNTVTVDGAGSEVVAGQSGETTSSAGAHNHTFNVSGTTLAGSSHSHTYSGTTSAGSSHSHTLSFTSGGSTVTGTTNASGSDEVRVKNVAFHCDIVAVAASAYALPTYTVETLPSSAAAGWQAFATNGRKNGEGAGLGTGVTVFHDGIAWRACDTGATVAS